MTTQEVKQEMEELIKEMAALCKTFSDSIQIIQYKEEKLESEVATALNNCNNKIEEINKKIDTQSSAQKLLPPYLLEIIQEAMNKRVTQNSLKH